MYNIEDQEAAAKQGFIALAIIWVAAAWVLGRITILAMQNDDRKNVLLKKCKLFLE